MSYEIILSPEFISRIEKLQKNLQKGILRKATILKTSPEYGKMLHGPLKGMWELKISKLRIFYTIDHNKRTVRLASVDFRGKLF